ncbi:MAG: hypothetical protein ABIQ40_00760 [Bacteroidia bacterium]
MKTIKILVLVSILSLALTSFNSKNTIISLEKALAEKKIELVILPLGGHSGNCINIEIKNLTNDLLNLEMKPGTLFVPDNEGEQTLVTVGDQLLVINKKEAKTFKVFAYCTEAHDSSPSKESKFQLATTQNANLKNLTSFLDSLKIRNDEAIQNSIWCVTDSHSVSNVYTDDPKSSKALRGFLCTATGQKDTWYNTKRDITVDQNNRIVIVTKEIKGELAFQSAVPVEIQGCVKDSTGKIIYQNPNKTNCPAGKIRFEFKLKVEGWAPGSYSVVYTNNGEEVLNQSFSF